MCELGAASERRFERGNLIADGIVRRTGPASARIFDRAVHPQDAILESEAFLDQRSQGARELAKILDVRGARDDAETNSATFDVGLFLSDLTRPQRAAHEQPRGQIEQARRQAHAFSCINDVDRGRERLGVLAAGPVEIGGGTLDERHAVLENMIELLGGGEMIRKRNGLTGPGVWCNATHDMTHRHD